MPGMDLGRTYRTFVLDKQPSEIDGQPCGDVGDIRAGTAFDVKVVEKGVPDPANNCRFDFGSVSGLENAMLGTRVPYWGPGGLGSGKKSLLGIAHTIAFAGGCVGEWRVYLFVPDRGDPFRVPEPGMRSPVGMIRTFYTEDVGPCLQTGFKFNAQSNVCSDLFDIRIEKK